MKNFYSKDFGTQDISYIGRFEDEYEANDAAEDDSDWIYRQDDLEECIMSALKVNQERFSVWVLTVAMDYEVFRQDIFLSKDVAEREFIALVNKEFEKEFTTPEECYGFICSDEWWDNDERLTILLSDVGINTET